MNIIDPRIEAAATVLAPVTPRRRLFGKYVAFFVGVVCLALLANNLLEYRFLVRDYTGFSVRLQREQAQGAANRIDAFVKDIAAQIAWTTQLPWQAASLDDWRLDAARLLHQAPAITEYIKLDAQGVEQLRVSRLAPDSIGSRADLSQDPRFTAARANGMYHGPVSFRRDSEPYMTIALRSPGNDVSIAEVNLKFIWDVVSQIKVGERGKAYVVNDRGRLIAHPDLGLVLRNTDATLLRQVRAARAGGPAIPPEDERPVEDFAGRRVLAAFAPVAALDGMLFVELPVDEAFAQLNAAVWRSSLVLLAALIIAMLAGLLLARKMVVPIAALQVGAARIGGGDFEQRIAVKTGDELEALADQFNHMAAQLQESHANLQLRVERRTAELTSANRRLANAGERLRRANAFKSEMLGTVAHDLKNPMSVIMTRTELLSGLINVTPLPREKIAANILSVRHAGNQLVDMVNSLLADAMTDAHEISIRRSPVDIPALISEVAESNRPHAERKQQTFAVAAPASLILSVDHDRLREAIDNLVSNAIKYTPRSGKIDLTVACEADHALIRVADDGPGLTADDMTRLFGRFQRLSARPTGGESSTGLGLSIVKRIAELHGGKVAAESAGSGRGTTFTISLPQTSAFPEMHGQGTAGDPPSRVHKTGAADAPLSGTILIIEDNSSVRVSLDSLLRSEGLSVVSAASGAEALELITGKQLRPDLVVSDYNLQENMNGLESIASLRAALGWNLPAIVLTGDSRREVLQAIARHKVVVVAKPCKGDELVQLIRESVRSSVAQAPQDQEQA